MLGVFAINPGLALTPVAASLQFDFDAELDRDEGWTRCNRHYWRRDWPGFAAFFFGQMFPEPHSSKQVEDCVSWARRRPRTRCWSTTAVTPIRGLRPRRDMCRAVPSRCRRLGLGRHCQDPERGRRLAELTGGDFVVLEGGGQLPLARDPVKINLLLRDFVRRACRATA